MIHNQYAFFYPYFNKIIANISSITQASELKNLSYFGNLPSEIFQRIFRQLSAKSLLGSSKVCRTFAQISSQFLSEQLPRLNLRHSELINKILNEGKEESWNSYTPTKSFSSEESSIIIKQLEEEGSKAPTSRLPISVRYPALYLPYSVETQKNRKAWGSYFMYKHIDLRDLNKILLEINLA
jgi:hypothetical protein